MSKLTLGERVKDIVNGFTGIVTVRHEYLNGCIQYTVEPSVGEDNKYIEPLRIDEEQLEKVDDGILKSKKKPKKVGGPTLRERGKMA